jgi:hypothetical protein
MYYLLYRGIPIKGSRRWERLSAFVAEKRYTAAEQRDMDIIYIPDDIEVLE